MSRRSEQILAVGIFVFCIVVYFILIPNIPLGIDTDAELGFFSPRVFPRFIIVTTAIISIFLGINAYRKRGDEGEVGQDPRTTLTVVCGACIVLAVGFVYTYLLEWIGYTLSTPVVLAFYLWFFGARSWIKIPLLAISTTVLLYFFFGKLLNVMLPAGRLF
jgi:hypothetical protein